MTNAEPSFVLYALLLDPGCCLRAHFVLIELVEPGQKKNWVLVGSYSPNPVVQLHICLKSEISVVFGFLKAAVDELPKETIELTTGL